MMQVHVAAEKVVLACDLALEDIGWADSEKVMLKANRRPTTEQEQRLTLIKAFARASSTGDVLMDMEEFARIAKHF